jgi:hypothetical protein
MRRSLTCRKHKLRLQMLCAGGTCALQRSATPARCYLRSSEQLVVQRWSGRRFMSKRSPATQKLRIALLLRRRACYPECDWVLGSALRGAPPHDTSTISFVPASNGRCTKRGPVTMSTDNWGFSKRQSARMSAVLATFAADYFARLSLRAGVHSAVRAQQITLRSHELAFICGACTHLAPGDRSWALCRLYAGTDCASPAFAHGSERTCAPVT